MPGIFGRYVRRETGGYPDTPEPAHKYLLSSDVMEPKGGRSVTQEAPARQGLWSFEIAVVPSLTGCGIREVSVGSLGHNIIVLLQEGPLTVASLAEKLSACFANIDREEQRIQILSELDYLAYHGIIEIKNNY